MISGLLEKELQFSDGRHDLSVNLNLPKGSTTALFGPSGSGKTSLLRMLAGLMVPDRGTLVVNSETWFESATKYNRPGKDRQVGYVFQDYALFPSMSVRENLEYAGGKDDPAYVNELLDVMELGSLQSRRPHLLSGGQKQRVALARALVQKPKLLLMDEPLSALDAEMRTKLQHQLSMLQQSQEITTVLVSHDLAEILDLADHVVSLANGRIIAEGSPFQVFSRSEVSGKCQFEAKILTIQQESLVSLVTLLVGTQVVKVVLDKAEVSRLAKGDNVVVAIKAFGPVIVNP